MARTYNIRPCPHNDLVGCDTSKHGPCERCGWHPEEFERRRDALSRLGIGTPSEELKHLIIKKEDYTVGNTDLQPNEQSTAADGTVELS